MRVLPADQVSWKSEEVVRFSHWFGMEWPNICFTTTSIPLTQAHPTMLAFTKKSVSYCLKEWTIKLCHMSWASYNHRDEINIAQCCVGVHNYGNSFICSMCCTPFWDYSNGIITDYKYPMENTRCILIFTVKYMIHTWDYFIDTYSYSVARLRKFAVALDVQ